MDIPDSQLSKLKLMHIEKHPGAICIANYKGGVGKTTITTLLGYHLAERGKKVLLIDIDPQCSLSLAVGFEPAVVNKTDFTIYHLVHPKNWQKIKKVAFESYVDAIPDVYAPKSLKIIKGSFDVDELDILITRELVGNEGTDNMLFSYCKNLVNSFSDFDYVLIDCPPNKMYLTQAMLRASSYYITVTIPDRVSIDGMPRLLRWVKTIPANEKPRMLGVVLNAVNRSGGNPTGTNNQQNASDDMTHSVQGLLDTSERKVISKSLVLTRIPRLDAVSKFLSQGDQKIAWFEFKKHTSKQPSLSEIMANFVSRVLSRIDEYGKV